MADSTLTTRFNAPVTHNYSSAALDSRLKTLWADMAAALSGKNLGLSQSFLLDKAEGGYEKVFYLLLPHMPTIVPGFSAPETVETGLNYAEYAIGETIDGTDRVFLIQLLRDARGVWKVEGM